MTRLLAVAVLALTACGPRGPDTAPDPDPTRTDGTHGAVCAWGDRAGNADKPAPAACDGELRCCYPCGIPGCDSQCATEAECEEWSMRP